MHVRDATHDDLESVATVHGEAVRGLDPGVYDREQLAAWDHDRDPGEYPLDDDRYAVVVAERDGEVVGFGQLRRPDGEVVAVYVHPDHWGEGAGSSLLANLEGRAVADGHRSVELVASKNAVGFYERAGYDRAGTEPVEPTDGVELECVRMVKELGPTAGVGDWGRLPV